MKTKVQRQRTQSAIARPADASQTGQSAVGTGSYKQQTLRLRSGQATDNRQRTTDIRQINLPELNIPPRPLRGFFAASA